MLVNDDEEKSNGTRCLFQPTVKIKSDVNGFRFCEYSSLVDFNLLDAEEQSLELQYEISAFTEQDSAHPSTGILMPTETAKYITTFSLKRKFLPWISLFLQGLGIHKEALSMRHLSDLDQTEKSQNVSELKKRSRRLQRLDRYAEGKTAELSACYKAAAESNIAGCLKARNRMLAGLKVLNDDSVAWTAFLLQTGQCLCSEYI